MTVGGRAGRRACVLTAAQLPKQRVRVRSMFSLSRISSGHAFIMCQLLEADT